VVVNGLQAHFPWLDVVRNVHSGANVWSVEVIADVIAENWLVVVLESIEPRCVLRHGEASLVLSFFACDNGSSIASISLDISDGFNGHVCYWGLIQVIPVELCHRKVSHLNH